MIDWSYHATALGIGIGISLLTAIFVMVVVRLSNWWINSDMSEEKRDNIMLAFWLLLMVIIAYLMGLNFLWYIT